MELNMEIIKVLREKTGAGMVDCRKSLEEAAGDIDQAIEILRKKGIARAAKRSERETSEGVIKVLTNEENNEGYILEVKAETDFVARTEKFQDFANQVLAIIKVYQPQNLAELLKLNMDKATVGENLDNLSGVIGEKIEIKRFAVLKTDGLITAYSHLGGKIGVLVAIDKAGTKDLAYDLAMQIAAANPKYIDRNEVPAEEIDQEKSIYREQLTQAGKPENMIEKIIVGKLNKYLADICLVDQDYIKEDKKKVKDILNGVKIKQFIRYSL
ncbi:MAG: translation elongation factor Ts [Candidatus Falkowbacteria bacterium]|nr:translation elongation factor Ts [Candidatus Falkowbacteria bacterium]